MKSSNRPKRSNAVCCHDYRLLFSDRLLRSAERSRNVVCALGQDRTIKHSRIPSAWASGCISKGNLSDRSPSTNA